MSEVKILKKDTTESEKRRLEAVRLMVRDEYSVVSRKVQGMVGGLAEIERRLAEIDRLIKALG